MLSWSSVNVGNRRWGGGGILREGPWWGPLLQVIVNGQKQTLVDADLIAYFLCGNFRVQELHTTKKWAGNSYRDCFYVCFAMCAQCAQWTGFRMPQKQQNILSTQPMSKIPPIAVPHHQFCQGQHCWVNKSFLLALCRSRLTGSSCWVGSARYHLQPLIIKAGQRGDFFDCQAKMC